MQWPCWQICYWWPFSCHVVSSWIMKGISSISQWTGEEMQKVYLRVLTGVVPAKVLAAACCLLDFIYHDQYQSHTTETLQHMQEALELFHSNKDVFVDLDICEHFNIPKLHSMHHYSQYAITQDLWSQGYQFCPSLGWMWYAKKGYCASNNNDYTPQMVKWLQHQTINLCTLYLLWSA